MTPPNRSAAFRCPECSALLAQSIIGDPAKGTVFEADAMRCNECGKTSPLAEWTVGVWTPQGAAVDSTDGLGGDIAGLEDASPYERDSVVLDTRNAVLLEAQSVAMSTNPSDGRSICFLLMEGRVNQSSRRARTGYLLNADAAASIVSQLVAIAARQGGDYEAEFLHTLAVRMDQIKTEAGG